MKDPGSEDLCYGIKRDVGTSEGKCMTQISDPYDFRFREGSVA